MPIITKFYGILIYMYCDEHNLPSFKIITNVEPLSNFIVKIIFADEKVIFFDLKPFFHQGSVFLPLNDISLFNQVKISRNGRSLEFPFNLDFCADSLWLKA
jgi:hypothetical protein